MGWPARWRSHHKRDPAHPQQRVQSIDGSSHAPLQSAKAELGIGWRTVQSDRHDASFDAAWARLLALLQRARLRGSRLIVAEATLWAVAGLVLVLPLAVLAANRSPGTARWLFIGACLAAGGGVFGLGFLRARARSGQDL